MPGHPASLVLLLLLLSPGYRHSEHTGTGTETGGRGHLPALRGLEGWRWGRATHLKRQQWQQWLCSSSSPFVHLHFFFCSDGRRNHHVQHRHCYRASLCPFSPPGRQGCLLCCLLCRLLCCLPPAARAAGAALLQPLIPPREGPPGT